MHILNTHYKLELDDLKKDNKKLKSKNDLLKNIMVNFDLEFIDHKEDD